MNIDIKLKITSPIICKEGRKKVGNGTGFFFEDKGQFFLVTNRHVFINENENFFPDKISIRLNTDLSDLTKSKDIEYQLYDKDTDRPKWIVLEDNIDIAAIPIDNPEGCIFAALNEKNLPPEDLNIGLGEQVLVIGYPKGFYDELHNLPIVRNASIASAYGIYFQKKPIFLIDSNLHPGTSGSPIITVPTNFSHNTQGSFSIHGIQKWYFLGINSGEFGNMQLNAIWYAHLITQMIKNHRENLATNNTQGVIY